MTTLVCPNCGLPDSLGTAEVVNQWLSATFTDTGDGVDIDYTDDLKVWHESSTSVGVHCIHCDWGIDHYEEGKELIGLANLVPYDDWEPMFAPGVRIYHSYNPDVRGDIQEVIRGEGYRLTSGHTVPFRWAIRSPTVERSGVARQQQPADDDLAAFARDHDMEYQHTGGGVMCARAATETGSIVVTIDGDPDGGGWLVGIYLHDPDDSMGWVEDYSGHHQYGSREEASRLVKEHRR